MSFVTQPICLNAGTKKDVTVTTSSGTPQLFGQISGPVQVRVANYDTVRVGLAFGSQSAVTTLTIAGSPTIASGSVEVFTVCPNPDNSPIYWNIIGDTGASGAKFEVTIGVGY